MTTTGRLVLEAVTGLHGDVAKKLASELLAAITPKPEMAARNPSLASCGEVPGHPLPDSPSWCETFNERLAYQQGIADARAMATALPPSQYAEELGQAVAAWLGSTRIQLRTDTGEPEQWVDTSVRRLGFAVRAVLKGATHGQG